jgi:hypothetical protein
MNRVAKGTPDEAGSLNPRFRRPAVRAGSSLTLVLQQGGEQLIQLPGTQEVANFASVDDLPVDCKSAGLPQNGVPEAV